jgi:ribosomal protein S18 acetylase RimI-like enzyme
MVRILQADHTNADQVAPLFDAYRQFYKQPSDLAGSAAYLQARLEKSEAIIFLAVDDKGDALGFTQLYPTFCSVEAKPAFILYDLFVKPEARREGVATLLLETAQAMHASSGAAWLRLETDIKNTPAQALYESQNWKRDDEFYAYFFFGGA